MKLQRQQGFTLLELLAAFLVFSLAFAVVLEIMSGSLRMARKSADYTQAALWAQSKMDAVGIDPPLEEGLYEGEFDEEYRWQLDIIEFENEGLVDPEFPITLYDVRLSVLWGDARYQEPREAIFRTLRAGLPRVR